MTLTVLVAAGYAVFGVAALVQLVRGYRRLRRLSDVPPLPAGEDAPRVSVIVAARDEARHVEAAVRSLLAIDYPSSELIVVDDRSTDRTAEILASVAREDPRLQVVTVTQLPDGWLGKNHALHVGAARATGTLLLFTDADVIFEPRALSRAVHLMHQENADHVTAPPELIIPSLALEAGLTYGVLWGFLALRPWSTGDPKSSAFCGIGAFNLVRAEAFREIGGFTRIPLRPDDDLKLGALIKRAGFRQIVVEALDVIRIEWYRTVGEAARGFRKNTFASLGYSVPMAIGAFVGGLAAAWPFVAVLVTDGLPRSFYMVATLANMAAFAYQAWRMRTKPWLAPLYPLAALATAWLVADVVTRNLWNGAIEWRGTWYPLDALRQNRV